MVYNPDKIEAKKLTEAEADPTTQEVEVKKTEPELDTALPRAEELSLARERDKLESGKQIKSITEAIQKNVEVEVIAGQKAKIRELDNRTGVETNFEISFKSLEDKQHITLKTLDGKEIDLNDFMPEGFHLSDAPKFGVYGRRMVGYEHLKNPSAFLISLFHELGHANYLEKEEAVTLAQLASKLIDHISNTGLTPLWHENREQQKSADSERSAWAYALVNLKKFKKEGLDVFAGFKNSKEIFDYINNCLTSYEGNRAEQLENLIGNYKQFDEYINSGSFKPLFAKRRLAE